MPPTLRSFVGELAERLAAIEGMAAVALGGSYARGTQRPDSDVDLGLYYHDAAPFDIATVRALADEVDDSGRPAVTDFGRWGRWVNGGAWLTIGGQRIDLIYRSIDKLEDVIDACERGEAEWDYTQQPPYGFHSHMYLGELGICRPLHDPDGALGRLKGRVERYPPALKRTIVSKRLWGVEFDLSNAQKFAARGDVYSTAGTLARCAAQLVQVVYALNERYFVNDKGALEEIASFALQPSDFGAALEAVLAAPGRTAEELTSSVGEMRALHRAVATLAGDLYERPEFRAGG